jgi:hypothetical protein
MIAERSGEPISRIAVFGDPDNWDAALLVNPVGNAERRPKVKSLAGELRRAFGLEADASPAMI